MFNILPMAPTNNFRVSMIIYCLTGMLIYFYFKLDEMKIVKELETYITALEVDVKHPEYIVKQMEGWSNKGTGTGFDTLEFVARLAGALMGHEHLIELGKIREQLDEQMRFLERGFSNIEHHIEQLTQEVKDSAVRSSFKINKDKVFDLLNLLHRYTTSANEHTKADLIRECEANNMYKFIGYIGREVQGESKLTIKELMVTKNDMREFGEWSVVLSKSVMTSAILHSYCLGIKISDIDTRRTVSRIDAEYFNNIWDSLRNWIEQGRQYILNNHMAEAIKDIEFYARNHEGQDHGHFCHGCIEILKVKYYYRRWMVGSYDGDTKEHEEHDKWASKFSKFWIGEWKRCFFIASTNNPDNEDIDNRMGNCIESRKRLPDWYYSASTIRRDLEDCVGGRLNALIVINEDHHPNMVYTGGCYDYVRTERKVHLIFKVWTYHRNYWVYYVQSDL